MPLHCPIKSHNNILSKICQVTHVTVCLMLLRLKERGQRNMPGETA